MAVILLPLLLRLQQVRDSRHTAVCLGTSSYGYCLAIVLYAVMTYDRSIGTREAGSGKLCNIFTYGSGDRTRGAPARQWHSAVIFFKKAVPRARSASLTRGSAETKSRVTMASPASDP